MTSESFVLLLKIMVTSLDTGDEGALVAEGGVVAVMDELVVVTGLAMLIDVVTLDVAVAARPVSVLSVTCGADANASAAECVVAGSVCVYVS